MHPIEIRRVRHGIVVLEMVIVRKMRNVNRNHGREGTLRVHSADEAANKNGGLVGIMKDDGSKYGI